MKLPEIKLMVCLVGHQPLPNLIPVRRYQPIHVLLLHSTTTQKVFENLRVAIGSQAEGLLLDAYDIQDFYLHLQEKIKPFSKEPDHIIFNLTSGTKAMAFAGYRLAADLDARLLYLESERRESRAYHFKFKQRVPEFEFDEVIPPCITLDDFLNVQLGKGHWSEEGYNRKEGGVLEQSVGETLKKIPEIKIKAGIKFHGQNDLDLVIQAGNQYGIMEIKTGEKGRKLDGIKQLSTNGRFLGTFTRQFYVIDQPPNDSHQAIVDASQVKVISLLGHDGNGNLPDESQNTLIHAVRKELIG